MNKRWLTILLTLSFGIFAECSAVFADQTKPVPAKEATQSAGSETAIKAAVLNHPRLVLKNGAHFLVLDETGLMPVGANHGYGLYKDDTRYLSALNFWLNGNNPVLLSASTEQGYAGRFIYGNATDKVSGASEQQVMLQREIVISDGVHERITLKNFGNNPVNVDLGIEYSADYADMFEVRGIGRKARGQLKLPEMVFINGSVLSYTGLDRKVMSTRIVFSEQPKAIQKGRARFQLDLNGQQSKTIEMSVSTALDTEFGDASKPSTYDVEKRLADQSYESWREGTATVTTGNTDFNRLLERSVRDLYILRQPTPRGNCLAAGIPWFAVGFGRDQEITSIQTMMFFPDLAKDVIEVLAAYQGTKVDEYTEERPGRIMHELRLGEMARLREIAFVPYYGTVDATPLWLVLISRYFDQSGDLEFVKRHWTEIELALQYLETESKSGYLSYGGKADAALSNQGWKDSDDSVMYGNGKLAKQPIALCEVQGYFYSALSKIARLAERLGKKEMALDLGSRASRLKEQFIRDFWIKDKNCFALALDGDGKQCDVVSSNMGHLLSTDMLSTEQADLVADALLKDDMFCQWGIRTLSSSEFAYNPMSYHNGSVWPHDNAMIVEGLSHIGRTRDANRVTTGLFETAKYRSDLRLPELFCGFSKSFSERPVWYPVSCAPQAWAAGSAFQMLSSILGLVPDAAIGVLSVRHPTLPSWLNWVEVKGIRVGKGSCDLKFQLVDGKTICTVTKETGELKVVIQE